MKKIWMFIDSRNIGRRAKLFAACLIYGLTAFAAGLAAGLIVQHFTGSTWDVTVCFAGYPAVTALLAVFICYFNFDFSDGKKD